MRLTDGERLLVYRKIGKWTQQEFAKHWDIHQTYVAAMERDSRPVRCDIAHFTEKLPVSIPANIMMTILRKRKRYSKHMIAGLTGIDARDIGKMERGLIPIADKVEKLLNS